MSHKDTFGNEIKIKDKLAYGRTYSSSGIYFEVVEVVGFLPKMLVVTHTKDKYGDPILFKVHTRNTVNLSHYEENR